MTDKIVTHEEFQSVRINPDNWTYAESIEFGASVRDGRTARSYELADMLIVGWTYDVPIEEGMHGLPNILEANKVLGTILDLIKAYGEDMETGEVDVDLTKWNLKRFLEFDSAKQSGKWSKVERMMKEVCNLKGVKANTDLTFTQGAKMMNAIMKAYSDSMTGKN